jgi:hypothetical protein
VPSMLVLDEVGRRVDRAIYVGLGGKIDDRVGAGLLEQLAHHRGVGDVALHETIPLVAADAGKRIEIGGVGKLVEIDDGPWRGADQMPADGGADEARPSGYDHLHGRPNRHQGLSSAKPRSGGCRRMGAYPVTPRKNSKYLNRKMSDPQ